MSAIIDLGTAHISTETAIEDAVVAFESEAVYLLEVIATDISGNDGNIYIFIKHTGDDAQTNPENHYGWMAYNLPLPGYNSYQTFRFAINNGDSICVAGSPGVSYHVQGIEQVV